MFTPQECENAELLKDMQAIEDRSQRLVKRNRELMDEVRKLRERHKKANFIIKALQKRINKK